MARACPQDGRVKRRQKQVGHEIDEDIKGDIHVGFWQDERVNELENNGSRNGDFNNETHSAYWYAKKKMRVRKNKNEMAQLCFHPSIMDGHKHRFCLSLSLQKKKKTKNKKKRKKTKEKNWLYWLARIRLEPRRQVLETSPELGLLGH